MKKFALHYNRCTVVTRYFNVNFAPFKKPWNDVDKQKKKFCLHQLMGHP